MPAITVHVHPTQESDDCGWVLTYPGGRKVNCRDNDEAIEEIERLTTNETMIVKSNSTNSTVVSTWILKEGKWSKMKQDRIERFLSRE